jgi:hypothetical protein
MKTTKNYNNLSKELKDSIPLLKPNETVTIQMLNGKPNPDPDPQVRKENPFLYGKTQLLTKFRIFDKYANEGKGAYVDVVLADNWNGDEPEKAKCFVAGAGAHQFMGKFDLLGGKVEDQELHEIFFISPQREGSPCADASVKPLFRFLNTQEAAKKDIGLVEVLRQALDKVKGLSVDEQKEIMLAMNKTFATPDELKAAVANFARTSPDKFLAMCSNPNTKIKALLKDAFDKKILSYQHDTFRVLHGDSVITTLGDTDDQLEGTASFLASAANGEIIIESIKKQLKSNKADKTKEPA